VQERIKVVPIYEFDCLKCKNTFTLMLSLSEYEKKAKAGVRCPKCQSKKVEQLVSARSPEGSRPLTVPNSSAAAGPGMERLLGRGTQAEVV